MCKVTSFHILKPALAADAFHEQISEAVQWHSCEICSFCFRYQLVLILSWFSLPVFFCVGELQWVFCLLFLYVSLLLLETKCSKWNAVPSDKKDDLIGYKKSGILNNRGKCLLILIFLSSRSSSFYKIKESLLEFWTFLLSHLFVNKIPQKVTDVFGWYFQESWEMAQLHLGGDLAHHLDPGFI